MRLCRCGKKLHAQDIANCVTLKFATDAFEKSVYVLQAAVAIIRRRNSKLRLHAGAPSLR